MSDLDIALQNLMEALTHEGPVPQYHHHVMRKHRSEWPRLWEAIDEIVSVYKGDSK